jgi:hypothetical protein
MTVQNLFTAVSTAIAAITKYDAAKQIKNKQTAKRVGAVLTSMSLLSPLPLAAALTAPLFNSCKQPVSGEETPKIISKNYQVFLGKTIKVEMTEDLFNQDVDTKLTAAFAAFAPSLPAGSTSEPKIKSWCDTPGAKIVIERTSNYAETVRDGIVLKVNIQYINDTANTNYIYQTISSEIVYIVDNP